MNSDLTLLLPSVRRQWGFKQCLLGVLLTAFSATAPVHAENLCANYPTHTEGMTVKRVAKPPYRKFYRDPAFGSKVIRVTNSPKAGVHKPLYSSIQAWNADESLLMLYRNENKKVSYVLLDGQNYKEVAVLNIVPSSVEDVFWSHNNPDLFYYINKYSKGFGEFREYNVKTNKNRVVRDFSRWCGTRSMPMPGNDVHMQSLDDDLFGFRCKIDNKDWIMFSYRLSTDTVISMPIGKKVSEWQEWVAPMPTPRGDKFWMQGKILESNLKSVNKTLDLARSGEHSSLGLGHDGSNTLYQVTFNRSPNGCSGDSEKGVGHLVEHNLDTGKCRAIVTEADGYPYTTSGTHPSALATKRPGWVAMSSMGYDQFDWFANGKAAPPLFSEIYLVNTDPANETVCRLAQHRSFGKSAKAGGYNAYFGEAHASISPSGTRIVFGSDWYDSGSVDAYIIELPAFKRKK